MGLYDINYENKVVVVLEVLKMDDFVYLYIEVSDEVGYEGDVVLKLKMIENLDSCVVGFIYEVVKEWEELVVIVVLFDYFIFCELCMYINELVLFFIWYLGIELDSVQIFDEVVVVEGSYGLLKEDEFIKEFMNC